MFNRVKFRYHTSKAVFPKRVVIYRATWRTTFWPWPSKVFFEKYFLYFFLKKPALKNFLIFREIELSSLKLKKLLIFREMELSYIFSKNIMVPPLFCREKFFNLAPCKITHIYINSFSRVSLSINTIFT